MIRNKFYRTSWSRRYSTPILNSKSIEDNPHYKRIRNTKQIDLLKSVVYPSETYINMHNNIDLKNHNDDEEHIYVFQNLSNQKTKIVLFECEEDAAIFTTLLEAECGLQVPLISKVDTCDIIELCKEADISCVLQPKGSMLTPMGLN